MNDIEYYKAHGLSHEEAKQQVAADRASTTLLFSFFKLLFAAFTIFILFIPGFFCAYLILHVYGPLLGNPTAWNYFWWMIGLVYFLECLVFLLKGWYISLKERGYMLWKFLWAICFLYCFAVPAILLLSLLSEPFAGKGHGMSLPMIIFTLASAAILGWLIYKRYQLSADSAPKWMGWAYRLGRLIPGDE